MENNIDNINLDTLEGRIETANKSNSGSFDMFKDMIEKMSAKFTPEYLEELQKQEYEHDRKYPENFSNWYPHIKEFGYFKCADVISNQIFTYLDTTIMRATDDYNNVNWESINSILKPTLDKMEPGKLYNIKNGCFSNKFDFKTCLATKEDLAQQLWKINYQSSMLETGGYTELVVRELIPYNYRETPTIYNGMPMREEIRVFYNMDRKCLEYIEDYWKYKYCRPNIYDKNDQIIFDWFHNKLKTRKVQHRERIKWLEDVIWENIHSLEFDDELHGIWSIDFMYVDDDSRYGGLWLIDMARGFRSAYWNIDKLTYKSQMELKEKLKNGR